MKKSILSKKLNKTIAIFFLVLNATLQSFAQAVIINPGLPAGLEEGTTLYVRKALETTRNKFNTPALGGSIVLAGKVMGYGAVGIRNQNNPNSKVTHNDRFAIGSVTKPVTSFIAARVMQSFPYKLSWSTPIKTYYPNSGSRFENNTVEDLSDFSTTLSLAGMSHPSCGLNGFSGPAILCLSVQGVSETANKNGAGYWTVGRNEFVEKMLRSPQGTSGTYNNNAPVVISAMIQKTADKTFEKCARDYVFGPMNSSAKFITEITNTEINATAFPLLHNGSTSSNVLDPVRAWGSTFFKYHIGHASGGLMISPRDMARLMIEMMPNSPDRMKILSNTNLATYLGGSTTKDTKMRGGWYNVAIKDKIPSASWIDAEMSLWHNGAHGNNTCYAEAFLFPNKNFAFMAVSNVGGNRGVGAVQDMSRHFMACKYQYDVLPLFNKYNPTFSISAEKFSANYATVLKDIDFLTTASSADFKPTLILSNLPKYYKGNLLSISTKTVAVTFPRNNHNIKKVNLYQLKGAIPSQATYELVQSISVTNGDDNAIFNFNPGLSAAKLKVEFEKTFSNQSIQVSEVIVR